MSWAVKAGGDGYVVTWAGESWGMEPQTEEWCREYMARLEERYPEGGAWLVYGEQASTRTRGGPWKWTARDGETDVIHLGRLADAKSVLRHRLRRKTLPAGITWTLEVDA